MQRKDIHIMQHGLALGLGLTSLHDHKSFYLFCFSPKLFFAVFCRAGF